MSGFVSFVSAGPGAVELLTLAAVDRLGRADVILHDDLAAGPILSQARPDADLIAVGKRAGRPSPRQAHVNHLLVEYARAGQRVVRLKSGDAGIFGRLEEELSALVTANIDFEIIPGVTSAAAAAATARIPLTRRTESRRLQFITGHDTDGRLPDDLRIDAIADSGATTAIYMGKRTFPALAERLVNAGLPGDTPALLAEAVTTPDQQMNFGTIDSLAARLRLDSSTETAVIIIGPLAVPGR